MIRGNWSDRGSDSDVESWEWLEGTGATEAVTVMSRAEYDWRELERQKQWQWCRELSMIRGNWSDRSSDGDVESWVWLEGTGVTEAVTVMSRTEYDWRELERQKQWQWCRELSMTGGNWSDRSSDGDVESWVWLEGTGVTEAVTVMSRAEYD